MKTENLITVNDFCVYYHIEYTFIDYLQDAGLVEVAVLNHTRYIPVEEIQKVEKLARLHTDLEINEPGVAAINSLLQKVENMQREMTALKNRLRLYED